MRVFTFVLLILMGVFCISGIGAETLPEFMLSLREAVYEKKLSAEEIKPLYHAAQAAARRHYSGTALDLALSRCEYFMGRALQFEKRNAEAAEHYAEGIKFAEKAIATSPSAAAWVMMAENLSQSCAVRSVAFAMANGLNVEKYAKNALAFDSRNAAAQHIIAARWVYAPSPFNNLKKGIEMMEEIIASNNMEKDDRFNVYFAIAYAYVQQKKYPEARSWLRKSLEIYPTNQDALQLLAQI